MKSVGSLVHHRARRFLGFRNLRAPTVEFRIPISANEKYLRMVHYFLESVRIFGGPIGREAHCVVSVSRDHTHRDLNAECPWASQYSVDFRWVEKDLFCRLAYDGTGADRLYVRSSADVVILADADILIAGDFDRVIWQAHRAQRLLGFIAHVSPFVIEDLRDIPSYLWWNWIHKEAGLSRPTLHRVHTGWGYLSSDVRHRCCPDYFNYGFVIAPRFHIERMSQTFEADIEAVNRVVETWFKSQIATTLSIGRHQIPTSLLPMNCNFPLHVSAQRMRELNPDPEGANQPGDVKVFHYLGRGGKANREIFSTPDSLQDFLQQVDLTDDEAMFQRKLRVVHESIEAASTVRSVIRPDEIDESALQQRRVPGRRKWWGLLNWEKDPTIFIVCGGRRTGTTLLAAILASDPLTNPLGQEAQVFTRLIETYRWGKERFDQFGRSFFEDLGTYHRFYARILEQFAREVSARICPGGVLVLKNPELSRVLLDLFTLLPTARLIVTVRDPLDQIASELEVGMRQREAGHKLPHIEQRNMARLSKLYLSYYTEIREVLRETPQRVHLVRYEDLVLRANQVLAGLRTFTGLELPFDPAKPWTDVSPLANLHLGPSSSVLYGMPISANSVGRSHRDLDSRETDLVKSICKEFMTEFGYSDVPSWVGERRSSP